MNISMKKTLSILAIAGMLSACGISSKKAETDYDVSSTYGTHEVMRVTVLSKKRVEIASNRLTGKTAGAVIGGVIGRSAGANSAEKTVGTIIGAIAGSAIGDSIEKNHNKAFATEYVIEDAKGDLQSVLVNDDSLNIGDKAFLILSDRPVLRKEP